MRGWANSIRRCKMLKCKNCNQVVPDLEEHNVRWMRSCSSIEGHVWEEYLPEHPYWVTFKNRVEFDGHKFIYGCIEATSEESAIQIANDKFPGCEVKECRILPYPALPILHKTMDTPAFCWRPETCQGRTACPRNPSCTE